MVSVCMQGIGLEYAENTKVRRGERMHARDWARVCRAGLTTSGSAKLLRSRSSFFTARVRAKRFLDWVSFLSLKPPPPRCRLLRN